MSEQGVSPNCRKSRLWVNFALAPPAASPMRRCPFGSPSRSALPTAAPTRPLDLDVPCAHGPSALESCRPRVNAPLCSRKGENDMPDQCHVCNSGLKRFVERPGGKDADYFSCPLCGEFVLSRSLIATLPHLLESNKDAATKISHALLGPCNKLIKAQNSTPIPWMRF